MSPTPPESEPSHPDASDQHRPKFPSHIAGYRIQRVIGSGGMAVVYAALQTQPRRVVAIKVMKAGLALTQSDHRTASRRFTREIEILGKLRHPYIAQIFAAGIQDDGSGSQGLPYFVMEYVPGAKTITEFIATHQLDLRDLLKLFVKVCAAIEHGHRRKVFHRDLKPANILIDETGEPKVIDFGVAQAADVDVANHTMHTEAGRLVGTIQYMSPEQLDARAHDLDARCDVYALGVLLYKMLTSKPPHDLEGLPLFEAVRMIREQSPCKPSALKPELKGDLETIILKAIEKDRDRRYRNAGSLGRDVVRYLSHQPIHAQRAGAAHRLGLFIKRHRIAMTSGGIVATIMSVALAIVLFSQGKRGMNDAMPPPAAPAAATPPAPPTSGAKDTAADPASAPQQQSAFSLRKHTGTITALSVDGDGLLCASAGFDRAVRFWNLKSRTLVGELDALNDAVQFACLSSDGSAVVIAGERGPVTAFTVLPNEDAGRDGVSFVVATSWDSSAKVRALAVSANGERVAISQSDLTLRIESIPHQTEIENKSDVEPAPPSMLIRSTGGEFTSIAFDTAGDMIATGTQHGEVAVWDLHTGERLQRFSTLQQKIVGLAFTRPPAGVGSEDVRLIAVSATGRVASGRLQSETGEFDQLDVPVASIGAMAFDGDGLWLACSSGTQIHVYDVAADPPQRLQPPIDAGETVYALAVDRRNRRCVVGFADGSITIVPIQME